MPNRNERPRRGGSYLRLPDGSLHRQTPEEEEARAKLTRKTVPEAIDALLSQERYGAAAVFARIKEETGLDTDADLAWFLGTTPQSLSNRKQRNSVPYREATFIAAWANTSLEYLLTGKRPDPDEDVTSDS